MESRIHHARGLSGLHRLSRHHGCDARVDHAGRERCYGRNEIEVGRQRNRLVKLDAHDYARGDHSLLAGGVLAEASDERVLEC